VDYARALVPGGLRGARLGVLRQAYLRPGADAEVLAVFDRAVADLRGAGATVVDSVPMPALDSLLRVETGECNRFRHDLEAWLASTRPAPPVTSLDAIVRSRRFHPSIQPRLEYAQRATASTPAESPGCAAAEQRREGVREAVRQAMDRLRLDALVYPTWSNPPRLIGDLNTPHGDNSQLFSPTTGWPAVQVPMGYTRGTLPAGLTFFGRAWSEPVLLRLAYGYEQATRHRRPPASTPPLRGAWPGAGCCRPRHSAAGHRPSVTGRRASQRSVAVQRRARALPSVRVRTAGVPHGRDGRSTRPRSQEPPCTKTGISPPAARPTTSRGLATRSRGTSRTASAG
jgi:hypothetical protein